MIFFCQLVPLRSVISSAVRRPEYIIPLSKNGPILRWRVVKLWRHDGFRDVLVCCDLWKDDERCSTKRILDFLSNYYHERSIKSVLECVGTYMEKG